MLNLENPYAPTREEVRAEANGRVVARTAVVRGGSLASPGAPTPQVEPVVEPAPAPSLRGLPGWTTVTEVSGSGEQVVFYVPPEELQQAGVVRQVDESRARSVHRQYHALTVAGTDDLACLGASSGRTRASA